MSVWGAALLLNCDEETIERRLTDGELAWAFNISTDATAHNRCVRIFTPCVLDFKASVKHDFTAPFVLNAIFPEARSKFKTHEVAFAWHCGAGHVRQLLESGALKKLPGNALRGPISSAVFSRAVLAEFLSKRSVL